MSKRLLVPLLTTVLTLGSVSPVLAGTVRDAGPYKILNMSVAEKLRSARGCVHAEPKVTLSPHTQTGLIPTSKFVVRMSRRTMQNVRRMSVIPNVSPHPTESGHLTVNRDALDSLSITSLMSILSNDEQPVGGLSGSPKTMFLLGLTTGVGSVSVLALIVLVSMMLKGQRRNLRR